MFTKLSISSYPILIGAFVAMCIGSLLLLSSICCPCRPLKIIHQIQHETDDYVWVPVPLAADG